MAMKKKIVVGVAGMPGAGKATVKEMIHKMGYSMIIMGDEIREETKRRKLEPTPEYIGMIMLKLREEEGPHVVAKRCISKIEKAEARVVIVDGVRSLHEVEEFKRYYANFTLLAIHSSPETRFKRLFQRKRSDDPKGWETFIERDHRELNIGLGNAIATADYMIVNEGTKAQLKKKISEFLQSVLHSE